jgi:hypothetical protein
MSKNDEIPCAETNPAAAIAVGAGTVSLLAGAAAAGAAAPVVWPFFVVGYGLWALAAFLGEEMENKK